jgi:hypothetical protein
MAVGTYESDFRLCMMGRGSVGFDIFTFRPELLLGRGSAVPVLGGARDAEELLLNHFDGFDRKFPRLGEGDLAGDCGDTGEGDNSGGTNVLKLPFRGGIPIAKSYTRCV